MYPFGEPITECSVLNISILVRVTIPQDFLIDLIDKFLLFDQLLAERSQVIKKKQKQKQKQNNNNNKKMGGGEMLVFC